MRACRLAEFLRRLAEKEHEHGIAYDKDVDAFLQACTVEGKASHPLTNFFLRILGLEVSRMLMWGSCLPATFWPLLVTCLKLTACVSVPAAWHLSCWEGLSGFSPCPSVHAGARLLCWLLSR